MSTRVDVLLWAQRIVNKGPHVGPTHLLEIRETAGLDEAQAAFHKVAKVAHPDMHRTSLSPEELELVTTAYSRVANAYQELRSQKMGTSKLPRATSPIAYGAGGGTPQDLSKLKGISGIAPAEPPKPATQQGPTGQMAPKALVYYRKAELALRRGDLKSAVLQIKMAIAADPLSQFLRQALSEVESELKGKG